MITVLTAEKKQVKTRPARIDTPEPGQDIGWRPKQGTICVCFDRLVCNQEVGGSIPVVPIQH